MFRSRKPRHPIVAAPLLLSLLAASGLSLLAASGATAAEVPDPRDGLWTRTSLALLDHGQTRCSEIGDGILSQWEKLSGSPDAQRSALDRYVLYSTTVDMAAARESLDIARGFLSRTTRESDAEAAGALLELFESATLLCNAVAQPAPPRPEFEARLEEIRQRVAGAQGTLSRLVAASPEDLEEDLAPYLPAIQEAADRAEEKNRRDLEQEPEVPAGPTLQDRMTAWHQSYYQATAPTKLALRRYLEGRQAADSRAIQEACRELLVEVQRVLKQPAIFQAPDSAVNEPLQRVYRFMHLLGGHCTAGRFDQVDEQYSRMTRSLQEAAQALAPYNLQP